MGSAARRSRARPCQPASAGRPRPRAGRCPRSSGSRRRCRAPIRACSRPRRSTITSCARARACGRRSSSDSGEPREVHHLACLVGFGADAVHPWLLFATVEDLGRRASSPPRRPWRRRSRGSTRACSRRCPRWASRPCPPTAARSVRVSGLDRDLVERHFTGSSSRLGGLGLDGLGRERSTATRAPTASAPAPTRTDPPALPGLPVGGLYRWRRDGERHGWSPETVVGLQRAIEDGAEAWGRYSRAVDDEARPAHLRGLLAFSRDVDPIHAREVEPADRHHEPLRDGRDEPRVDLPGDPRDARDRDEPHRRQVEHRRGRRGPGALHARPERRPAPLGDQAGRLRAASASRPTTSPTPTSCRSRSRRAPSRARAASSRATRSTTTSASSATPRPASS